MIHICSTWRRSYPAHVKERAKWMGKRSLCFNYSSQAVSHQNTLNNPQALWIFTNYELTSVTHQTLLTELIVAYTHIFTNYSWKTGDILLYFSFSSYLFQNSWYICWLILSRQYRPYKSCPFFLPLVTLTYYLLVENYYYQYIQYHNGK